MIENESERGNRGVRRAVEWRRTIQWTTSETSQEQRSRVKRRTKKASASWRRRNCVRRRAGPDCPGAPEALCATRGAGERSGGIDVLHSVPIEIERNREIYAMHRKDPQRHGGKSNKCGKRKSTHMVLQRDAEGHREDHEDQECGTEFPGPGKGRSFDDDQDGHRRWELHRAGHMETARILLQTFAKPVQIPRSRIIFAVEGVLSCKWKKEADGDQRGSPFAPLEEVLTSQDGPNKRRVNIQDLISNRWKKLPEEVGLSFAILQETLSTADGAPHKRRIRIQHLVRHAMVVCGAEALPGRAPRGNLSRELSRSPNQLRRQKCL